MGFEPELFRQKLRIKMKSIFQKMQDNLQLRRQRGWKFFIKKNTLITNTSQEEKPNLYLDYQQNHYPQSYYKQNNYLFMKKWMSFRKRIKILYHRKMHGQWICDEDFFSKISQIGNWPIWADEANKLCTFFHCVPLHLFYASSAALQY